MTRMTITQGLPGSGKTTWAEEEAARTGAVPLGLDRLRAALHGGWRGDDASEKQVRLAQLGATENLLRAGISVIVDDVGLDEDYTAPLVALAELLGVDLVIEDRFLTVPIAECIARDSARSRVLGADVIHRLAARYRLAA